MNSEVVISGAWQGFDQGVRKWAKDTRLQVSRKMGLVFCSSDRPEDLTNLQTWLKKAVSSGQPRNVVSFESALFPPMGVSEEPTSIQGLAGQREREVLDKLPGISATLFGMTSRVK